jgi:purine-nucleoside phosphorylase
MRAKMIATRYLSEARLVTDVRNILGYTGLFQGKPVSVLSTGMGAPSMGIYSYELYSFYNVEAIIRIGTCGGLQESVAVGDLVAALSASTDGAYARQYGLDGTFSPCATYSLVALADTLASKLGFPLHTGMVYSSEYFSTYNAAGSDSWKAWARMGALAQDMETYALYCNAAYCHKSALSLLTMTDSLVTNEGFGPEQRMSGLYPMVEVALRMAYEL